MVELPQPLHTLWSYCKSAGGSTKACKRGSFPQRDKIWVLLIALPKQKNNRTKQNKNPWPWQSRDSYLELIFHLSSFRSKHSHLVNSRLQALCHCSAILETGQMSVRDSRKRLILNIGYGYLQSYLLGIK